MLSSSPEIGLKSLLPLVTEVSEEKSPLAMNEAIHSLTLTLSHENAFFYKDKKVAQIYMVGNLRKYDRGHASEYFKENTVRLIFQLDNQETVLLCIKKLDHDEISSVPTVYKILRSLGGIPEDTFSSYGQPALPKNGWLVPHEFRYKENERDFYKKAHQKCAELLVSEIKKNPSYLEQATRRGVCVLSLGCGDGKEMEVCEKVLSEAGFKCRFVGVDFNLMCLEESQIEYPDYQFLPLDLENMHEEFPRIIHAAALNQRDEFIAVMSLGSTNRNVLDGSASVLPIMHELSAHHIGKLFIQTGWTQPLTCRRSAMAAGWDSTVINHCFGMNPFLFSQYKLIYLSHRLTKEKEFELTLARSTDRIRDKGFTTLDLSETYNPAEQCQTFTEKKGEDISRITQIDISWSRIKKSDAAKLVKLLKKFPSLKFVLIENHKTWATTFIQELKKHSFETSFQVIKRMDSVLPFELPTLSVKISRQLKIYDVIPYQCVMKISPKGIVEVEEKVAQTPTKKLMRVNPYEGFVCKRDGNHAGVVMPNFNTCYAIIILTKTSLFALHYPSRTFSKQFQQHFKKWSSLAKEDLEHAWIVTNKAYRAFGSTSAPIEDFQAQLNKKTGLIFTIREEASASGQDFLIVKTDGTIQFSQNDLETHKDNYENHPPCPSSRLRYYTCRAQFFSQNDNFPLMIVGSKNFLSVPDEKEWPLPIKNHIALIRQKKTGSILEIRHDLIEGSQDQRSGLYFWAKAIGVNETDFSGNLKHYLYLLLGILYAQLWPIMLPTRADLTSLPMFPA